MLAALDHFDALMLDAEQAVATYDGAAMTRSTHAIGQWVQTLRSAALNEEQMLAVKERVARYRDLCAFLAKNLQDAIVSATEAPREMAGYRARGAPVRGRAESILTRTYG